ncbi:MAG: hypothetical protein Kow0076_0140 [Francisella sp.]
MIKTIATCVACLLASYAFSNNFKITVHDKTPEKIPLVDSIYPTFFDVDNPIWLDNIKFDLNKKGDSYIIASTNLPDDFTHNVILIMIKKTFDVWWSVGVAYFNSGKLYALDGKHAETTMTLYSLYKNAFNVTAIEKFYTDKGEVIGEFTVISYKDGKAKVTVPDTVIYQGHKIPNNCIAKHDAFWGDYPVCNFFIGVTNIDITIGKYD